MRQERSFSFGTVVSIEARWMPELPFLRWCRVSWHRDVKAVCLGIGIASVTIGYYPRRFAMQ